MAAEKEVTLRDLRLREGSPELELRRIRQSASFRFGILFVRAIQNPLRLLRFPFDLVALCIELARGEDREDPVDTSPRASVLLISSREGARHARTAMLARHLLEKEDDIEVVHLGIGEAPFHSHPDLISYAHPDPRNHGAREEALLTEQLDLLMAAHRPSAVLFDGPHAHRSISRSIETYSDPRWCWLQPAGDSKSEAGFDEVFRPGDLLDADTPALRWARSPTRKAKGILRARLGLDPHTTAVYCRLPERPSKKQVGQFAKALRTLRDAAAQVHVPTFATSHPDWVDLHGATLLPPGPEQDWIAAFDVAIIDGSYPASVEFPPLGIPGLILPRLGGKRGEAERAEALASAGLVLQIKGEVKSQRQAIRILLDPLLCRTIRNAAMDLSDLPMDASQQVVDWLVDAVDSA